jgi:hypothetical protein
MSATPAIAVIDARDGGPPAAAKAAEPQMRELLRGARRIVSAPALALADLWRNGGWCGRKTRISTRSKRLPL